MVECQGGLALETTRAGVVRSSIFSGVLVGLGFVAFLDEAVFHQLLHWHHFYDRSTSAAGLVSDGLFHAFSFFAVVAGMYLLADLRRREAFQGRRWLAGFLASVGAFQLYDGLVQHKLLELHQIRYGVDIAPYDVAWNGIAVVILAAGIIMLIRTREGAAR